MPAAVVVGAVVVAAEAYQADIAVDIDIEIHPHTSFEVAAAAAKHSIVAVVRWAAAVAAAAHSCY